MFFLCLILLHHRTTRWLMSLLSRNFTLVQLGPHGEWIRRTYTSVLTHHQESIYVMPIYCA
jgi:hypothetical protein